MYVLASRQAKGDTQFGASGGSRYFIHQMPLWVVLPQLTNPRRALQKPLGDDSGTHGPSLW